MTSSSTQPDKDAVLQGLQAVFIYVNRMPLGPDERARLTFRQIHNLVAAQEREQGVDPESLKPWRDDPDVSYWIEKIGISMDERQLLDEDHHLDLPLAYMTMHEYDDLLQAEDAFWQQQRPGPVDTTPLFDLVRKYALKG